MKRIIFMLFSFGLFTCSQPNNNIEKLQDQIDHLETELANTYKPGFGELMNRIQTHHAKLWFAGQNENWKLAKFEIHEIEETLESIEKYQKNRKESQLIGMMNPSLERISLAIKNKNTKSFNDGYVLLNNACNQCHLETQYEYNIVKTPTINGFSNQDFKIN